MELNMGIEKPNLDFSLDGDKSIKKDKVDFLLNDKSKQASVAQAATDLVKAQLVSNNTNQTKVLTVDPDHMISISAYIKRKPKKDRRLQTYVTEEVYQAMQNWKRTVDITKDSDAIEALIRIALGLKQI